MLVKNNIASFNVVESQNINFWIKKYQFWENDTFNFLFKYFDKNKIFLDIGSWIGPISLIACKYSKQCICYEPDELAYKEFLENIKLNNIENIILENFAVSIHEKINLGAEKLGSSTTREDSNDNVKTYNCVSLKHIFSKYKLDEQTVSVIKIDIEGHESELLKDNFLWNLNIPMHISLHPGWKKDPQKYFEDIIPFFEHKNINVINFDSKKFFTIEIN